MDPDMQRRAHEKAAELGISFAEYVRRLVAQDVGEQKPRVDVSAIFDLGESDEPTDIAHNKDKMIGDALLQDHLHKTRNIHGRPKSNRRYANKKSR
jgi:hypothetical protein